jgi:hypothetical protein
MKNNPVPINDTIAGVSYCATAFSPEQIVVVFPYDPNGTPLSEYSAGDRRAQICERAKEEGIAIDWRSWRYYEVRPDPDRLWIRTSILSVTRHFIFWRKYRWEEHLTPHFDFGGLDKIANDYELPTIREYYSGIQAAREAKKRFKDESMRMLDVWTQKHPTEELLRILHHDLRENLDKVRSCNWGWHYVQYAGDRKFYYRSPNAETLLKSFILQAEECFRANIPTRFAYCLPEFMPEGIEYQMSPVQD